MYKKLFILFFIALTMNIAESQNNRVTICDKLVKMGVTYLTSKEMQKVAKCMEKTMIDIMPYDGSQKTNDKVYNALLGCLVSNLLTKATSAMNMLNQFQNCLKPSNMSCLADKVIPPLLKQLDKPYKQVTEQVVKCKKNRAGDKDMEVTCSDKAYKIILAYLNKDYVDGNCKQLLPKINRGEFECCKDVAAKVMNLSKFTCQNKIDKCKSGTTPTCPAE